MGSNRVEIDFVPYLCEAFSTNPKIYKDIDLYYNKNKSYYYELAKNNEYYNHPIALEGSFKGTEYFRKVLGLLSSEEFSRDHVFYLIKKGWNYIYTYVNNKNSFTLEEFCASYLRKVHGIDNSSDDELNSCMTIFLWYTISNFPDKLQASELLGNSWKRFDVRLKHYKGESQYNRLSFDNLPKEKKKLINTIILKLKSIGFSVGRIYEDSSYGEDEDILSYKMKLEILYDFYKVSLPSIYPSNIFKEKDLKEILTCYVINKNDIEEIDFNELLKFVLSAINIKGLTHAYLDSKQYYLSNNKDYYEAEIDKLNNAANEYNIELDYFKMENKKLNDLIAKKEKQIKMLENKLEKTETNNNEVDSLRELMFSLSDKSTDENSHEINVNDIDNQKGIIVGGFDSIHADLKEVLTNWKFISVKSINYDVNLLNDRDIVVFMVNYMSHALYYKTIENIKRINKGDKDIKIGYVNNNNYNLVLEELNNIICKYGK